MGHNVTLVSLGRKKGEIPSSTLPEGTRGEIRKTYTGLKDDLRELLALESFDVIFWPVAWREPRGRIRVVGNFGIPLVGYFPGGCYSLRSSLYAIKRIGFKAALPYLLESVSPKSTQLKCFKDNGFHRLIAMTDLTAKSIAIAGWPEKDVYSIPPGRDEETIGLNATYLPGNFLLWLGTRPYYLFMGAPSGIRGIYELLGAFDIAAEKHHDICLVTLFRADVPSEENKIRTRIAGLRHRDRVYATWRSLKKAKLHSFISNCHGVIFPFVLVPSEIPLTIIESMGWGKPIIATVPSGTGEFVQGFGAVAKIGDAHDLARIMVNLITDKMLYSAKSKAMLEKYRNHPSWREVALKWLEVGKSVISA